MKLQLTHHVCITIGECEFKNRLSKVLHSVNIRKKNSPSSSVNVLIAFFMCLKVICKHRKAAEIIFKTVQNNNN